MWYDDVVAATSYIGPVLKRKKVGPAKSAEEMAKAHEALAKGDLAAAWRHLDKVDSDELYREAQEKLRKIEDAVNARIRERQALEAIGRRTTPSRRTGRSSRSSRECRQPTGRRRGSTPFARPRQGGQ
jgi:hypothetical protein